MAPSLSPRPRSRDPHQSPPEAASPGRHLLSQDTESTAASAAFPRASRRWEHLCAAVAGMMLGQRRVPLPCRGRLDGFGMPASPRRGRAADPGETSRARRAGCFLSALTSLSLGDPRLNLHREAQTACCPRLLPPRPGRNTSWDFRGEPEDSGGSSADAVAQLRLCPSDHPPRPDPSTVLAGSGCWLAVPCPRLQRAGDGAPQLEKRNSTVRETPAAVGVSEQMGARMLERDISRRNSLVS